MLAAKTSLLQQLATSLEAAAPQGVFLLFLTKNLELTTYNLSYRGHNHPKVPASSKE